MNKKMYLTKDHQKIIIQQVEHYLKQWKHLGTKQLRIKLIKIINCSNYDDKKQFCKLVLQNHLPEVVAETEETMSLIIQLIKNKLIHLYDYLVQITLIGDHFIGKGSLLRRYMSGAFAENDFYSGYGSDFQTFVYENTDEEIIKVRVWILVHSATDKIGSNKISETYFDMPAVNLVTFSFSVRESFISAHQTLAKLQELNPQSLKFLVGTQNDLKPTVTEKEAQHLADTFNVFYNSTSAKSGMNVSALFDKAINWNIQRNKKLHRLFVEKKQIEFTASPSFSTSLFNFLGSFFSFCHLRKHKTVDDSLPLDPETCCKGGLSSS